MKQRPSVMGVHLLRITQIVAVLAIIKFGALLFLCAPTPKTPHAKPQNSAATAIRHTFAVAPAQAETQKESSSSKKDSKVEPSSTSTSKDILSRQSELAKQEADLRLLEQELDKKLQNLKALENRVQKLLESAKNLQEEKMRHLVDVYSNMKPKQAAQVLETLDESIAVKILAGMSGRKAGEVLSYVKAIKAARLSEALTKLQTGQE